MALHIDDVKGRNTMRDTFIKQHDATDCALAILLTEEILIKITE